MPRNIQFRAFEDYIVPIGDLYKIQPAIVYLEKCQYSAKRRLPVFDNNWCWDKNMKPRVLISANPEENTVTPAPSSYIGETTIVHEFYGYAEGLIERAEFEPHLVGFRQRIEGWDKQIKGMRDEVALQATLSLVIGRLEDFAQRVGERMSKIDWLMQRELIRLLVKRVEIDHDDVNVVFRIDCIPPTLDPISPGRDSFWQDCGRVDKSASRCAAASPDGAGTGPPWHVGSTLTCWENMTSRMSG